MLRLASLDLENIHRKKVSAPKNRLSSNPMSDRESQILREKIEQKFREKIERKKFLPTNTDVGKEV